MNTASKLYNIWRNYLLKTDGMIPDKIKKRGLERVLHKAAFANVMRSNFTTTSIGAVINMNHSTIIHYNRLQDVYSANYELYNQFEASAFECMNNEPQNNMELLMEVRAQIANVERVLAKLKSTETKLEIELTQTV